MILFISNSGECLPIAWRMLREGEDVAVYIHNPAYRQNGDGMVPKAPVKKLLAKSKKADLVIFDITRPNEKTKADLFLLKMFKEKRSSETVFGPVADAIKKHTTVIGASEWTERLEMDRYASSDIAKEIGLRIPTTHQFNDLKEGIKFLKGNSGLWVFKPHNNMDLDLTYVEQFPGELQAKMQNDFEERLNGNSIEYVLQKKINGIEISTEGWFDGEKFVQFNHTIEDKRLMNYDLGPTIGSQGNTVWVKKDSKGLLTDKIKRLASYLKQAGYIGPVDINAVISRGKPYFLEFSPRFGYDALFCLLTLLRSKVSDFFSNGFKGAFREGFATSQRITVPPFPYHEKELLEDFAKDIPIMGTPSNYPNFWMEDVYAKGEQLYVSGADGIVGVVAAHGNSLGGSIGNMYRAIEKLKIASYLQYRTDGGKRAKRAIRELDKKGIQLW